MSESPSVTYIIDLLGRDPVRDSDAIIAARQRELGLNSRKNSGSNSRRSNRSAVERAHKMVDSIRQQFWTLPEEDLQQQVRDLQSLELPELEIVAGRLQEAANLRNEYAKLSEALGSNCELISYLKRSVTLSPRDAAGLREQLIRRMAAGEISKRIRNDAINLKTSFPNIYAFEHQWIDDIIRGAGGKTKGQGKQSNRIAIPWVIGILIYAAIRILSLVTKD